MFFPSFAGHKSTKMISPNTPTKQEAGLKDDGIITSIRDLLLNSSPADNNDSAVGILVKSPSVDELEEQFNAYNITDEEISTFSHQREDSNITEQIASLVLESKAGGDFATVLTTGMFIYGRISG